jgi:hypothetical protein
MSDSSPSSLGRELDLFVRRIARQEAERLIIQPMAAQALKSVGLSPETVDLGFKFPDHAEEDFVDLGVESGHVLDRPHPSSDSSNFRSSLLGDGQRVGDISADGESVSHDASPSVGGFAASTVGEGPSVEGANAPSTEKAPLTLDDIYEVVRQEITAHEQLKLAIASDFAAVDFVEAHNRRVSEARDRLRASSAGADRQDTGIPQQRAGGARLPLRARLAAWLRPE